MASTPSTPPPVPSPLLGEKLQLKPKKVRRASTFRDLTGLGNTEPYVKNLLEIVRRIEQGIELLPKHYRNHIGKTPDPLLQHTGVKHLHLGDTKSDVLLFLQEYDGFVMLLEIADHGANFGNLPVGAILQKHHLAPLQPQLPSYAAEAKKAADKAARLAKIRSAKKPTTP